MAGGSGGGGGRTPVEAPDSLRSEDWYQVLDLVCEGEIGGLYDGAKSLYLDGTPLQNPNTNNGTTEGTFNFDDVIFEERTGTQSQLQIDGFGKVESEVSLPNPEVTFVQSRQVSVTNTNITHVRVNMSFPRLTNLNSGTGDLNGTSVKYQIELDLDGGGFTPQLAGGVGLLPLTISSGLATTGLAASGFSGVAKWESTQFGQNITYDIEYKLTSSGTWTTLKQISLRRDLGFGVGAPPPATSVTKGGSFSVEGLPEGEYEFRATKISGAGTVSLVTANEWTYSTEITVSGKTTTGYKRSHILKLPESGWVNANIRVTRLTADSTTTNLSNKTYWLSYTQIIDHKLSYPNSAMYGWQIKASPFTSLPERAYELKLLKIQIPSNYDPIARTYTGIWDGTFKVAWSDNPAWCFYDLVTSSRYGLGGIIDSSLVDKSALYTIAQYCDELVPSGGKDSSGVLITEPRFTCNLYLQTREEAYKVLTNMASIFRGMLYWSNNQIIAVQDSPEAVYSQFNNSDVVDGLFNYEGSASKTRHSVTLVTWNDPDKDYKQTIEYVEDSKEVALNGIKEAEIVAVGCTSRGQAHRVGLWLLYTEKAETEVVTFKAGLDASQVYPGKIIRTSDQHRAGVRHGGRIISSTASTVTLDAPLTINGLDTYTLSNVLPNGQISTSTITNGAGTYTTVDIDLSFAVLPDPYSIWVVASDSVSPEEWRVISVVEDERNIFTISALEYNSSKYNAVELGWELQEKQVSLINATFQAPPTALAMEETLYLVTPALVASRLIVSWTAADKALKYVVTWIKDNENPVVVETANLEIELLNTLPGEYTAKVIAYNSIGTPSETVTITQSVLGLTAPPSDVTNFSISTIGTISYLSWDEVPDLDLTYYQIRFAPVTSGGTWISSTTLINKVSKGTTTISVPSSTGTYFIKAFDSSESESINAALVVTNIANIEGLNVVATLTENPTFVGDKDGGKLTVVSNQLKLTDPNANPVGTYTFANSLDLGAVYTSRVTTHLLASSENTVNFMSTWATLSSVETLSGALPKDSKITLNIRTTNDDPAGSPTWSNWKPFIIGDYTARAMEFQAVLTSIVQDVTPVITELGVTIDMPDRVAGEDNLLSAGTGTPGLSVVYSPKPFRVLPALAISAEGLTTGDYYVITNKTVSGFDITFYNNLSAQKAITFDYVAKGYGYAN